METGQFLVFHMPASFLVFYFSRQLAIIDQPRSYHIPLQLARCQAILLFKLANKIKVVDDKFINEAGNDVTDECCRYLLPLIAGEASPKFIQGIPDYIII